MTKDKMKTIEQIMKEAMSASANSYYKSKQPLGESGDFITSSEISQMFGEMIGIWVLSSWEKLGRPTDFNLVELGPGRGLLMRDLLRATSKQIFFQQAVSINLLDINPFLIEEQKKNLEGYNINWIKNIEDLTPLPSIFIANEFFDALPVRQYVKKDEKWEEVMVGSVGDVYHPRQVRSKRSNADQGSSAHAISEAKDSLFFMDSSSTGNDSGECEDDKGLNHHNANEGAIIEESPESIQIMQSISSHIKVHQGAALIIDYGYDIAPDKRTKDQYNSTLQAVKDHKFHPVFENLGEVDLSCHVDFYALKNVALKQHLKVFGAITQDNLLKDLGIDLRLKMLIDQNPELAAILQRQYDRLMSKNQMGELFKAIVIEN